MSRCLRRPRLRVALPRKWTKGSVFGPLAGGDAEVSIDWERDEPSATVWLNVLGETVTLKGPFGKKCTTVNLNAGQLTKVAI